MIPELNKLRLLIGTTLLILTLMCSPGQVQAIWPPLEFRLIPTYENGKITYNVEFSDNVDWLMTDVVIKIPLPQGARFLEGHAQPATSVSFDGTEVTFFTAALYQPILNASFVVEVTDLTKTVFTTQAWIAWEGDQPGDYLTDEISFDITRPALNWAAPARSRLNLEASAMVADNVITYSIYTRNMSTTRFVRLWDVTIKVPLPEGTTFLSAEASPPFTASFDGQEVTFFAAELERHAEVGPLRFEVSASGVTTPVVITHAWATWKNAGYKVGLSVVPQEQTRTGDIIVQPNTSQSVVSDVIGDVPFSNYDLTSIIFQEEETALKIIFNNVGDLGPAGQRLEYFVYLDRDCRLNTGRPKGDFRGAEYRVRYRYRENRADIGIWDGQKREWSRIGRLEFNASGGRTVTLWVPYTLLGEGSQLCWKGQARNLSKAYSSTLPDDLLPGVAVSFNKLITPGASTSTLPANSTDIPQPNASANSFITIGDDWKFLPGWSAPPASWNIVDFDDSGWYSGPTEIGYGQDEYATDLRLIPPPVQSDDTSLLVPRTITQSGVVLAVLPSDVPETVFMRRVFNVTNLDSPTRLWLEVDYVGGFVAYLNGVEVARRNLGQPGSPVSYHTAATGQQVPTSEVVDLSDYLANLVTGVNVLALQVHSSLDRANLSIAPKLAWASDSVEPTPPDGAEIPVSTSPPSVPAVAPSPTTISGKMAVPLDHGHAVYDVYIFSLPTGQEIAKIPNARQPNFRYDGQRLLINHEGNGIENVYEYNLLDGTEKQVSDAPQDWHPFYDPWGNRLVYGNAELTYGKPEQLYSSERNKYYFTGVHKPFIFVQCGLLPPHEEKEPRCRDIPSLGVLVPAGQSSEIQGTHPVWTSNDMIAYKGCNSWAGFGLCGIYIVPSASTKGFSDGFIPRQLTRDTSDTPTDAKGNLIAFMSQRDGNWETYIMDLNGAGVKNLSNNPTSNDGLPTISPDGNWIAFASDREGRWAIWVAPMVGGTAEKLFDLPAEIPWGDRDRDWTNERISWGP